MSVHRYGVERPKYESRPQLKFTVILDEVYPKRSSREMSAVEVCNKYPESCSVVTNLPPGGMAEFASSDGEKLFEVRRVYGRMIGMHPDVVKRRTDALEEERYVRERLEGSRALQALHRRKTKKPKIPLKRFREQAMKDLMDQGISRREAAELLYVAAGDEGDEE